MNFKSILFISSAVIISACAIPNGGGIGADISNVNFVDKYGTPISGPGTVYLK